LTIKLSEDTPVPELLIQYLNRISDYFFTLSRKFAKDLNIQQINWKPRL
jgi:cob(I)alamin adenosyltransferase